MKEIQAILFDLGNTLTRSASLLGSIVGVMDAHIAQKLNLSRAQLCSIGIEIDQAIRNLYSEERLDQPDWRQVWAHGAKNGKQKNDRCPHRGDNQFAPVNSLAAFASAIDRGADAIEFDVHWTKDTQWFVQHDYYLGRTEKGQGYISDFTLGELKAFDIGSWFDPTFTQEHLPTLWEVLVLGKG